MKKILVILSVFTSSFFIQAQQIEILSFADSSSAGIQMRPSEFTEYNGLVFFSGGGSLDSGGFNNSIYDRELWVTNGTFSGTYLFKDINPTGGSNPSGFTEYNGKLYFSADDGVHG